MVLTLKGMTWDHTRGYAPMVATAEVYARSHPNVRINWEKRSLQAFADCPIQQLSEQYDVLVIDHPHVGTAARAGCLVALDSVGRDQELVTLAMQSVGPSHQTYEYDGHQWALAIDAATQVACFRPDLLERIPQTWNEAIGLAREGRVLWPIKPVDALMSFFTLAANRGTACDPSGAEELIPRDAGIVVLNAMSDLACHVPSDCLGMNPIQVYERMSSEDRFVYCPLGYGYTNYARDGYSARLLRFCNIPALGRNGPVGSCIGGTGIAVSARCANSELAIDYAFCVASSECQKGDYLDAGGQPGNSVAWEDERANQMTHNFFRETRATLDLTYVRPRYDGYLDFQDQGGTIVNEFLAGKMTDVQAMESLQRAYEQTRARKSEAR